MELKRIENFKFEKLRNRKIEGKRNDGSTIKIYFEGSRSWLYY